MRVRGSAHRLRPQEAQLGLRGCERERAVIDPLEAAQVGGEARPVHLRLPLAHERTQQGDPWLGLGLGLGLGSGVGVGVGDGLGVGVGVGFGLGGLG